MVPILEILDQEVFSCKMITITDRLCCLIENLLLMLMCLSYHVVLMVLFTLSKWTKMVVRKDSQPIKLEPAQELDTVMLNAHMISNGLTGKQIAKTGNLHQMIQMLEQAITVLVVRKWIFGKLTHNPLRLLLILAAYKDKLDVMVPIVVTIQIIDMMVSAIRMDVILILSAWVITTSSDKVLNLQLILQRK